MNSFSKVFVSIVALTYFVLPSVANAEDTVSTPTPPITEEVAPAAESEQPVSVAVTSEGAENTSSSEKQSGLLDDNLNNATDRGVIANEEGLTVKTGIDKTAVIAGVIATIIGFSVFAMIGILRKINDSNDEIQEK